MPDFAVLDDPVGQSLLHRHQHLARRTGTAATYREGVSTFSAVPADPSPSDWDDLARLLGSGGFADLFSAPVTAPAHWEPVFSLDGHQMVLSAPLTGGPSSAAVELGPSDVADMLALAEQTRPGPFWADTIEMGTFVGIRDAEGVLVAMAGERLCPPGWTEISAVCTAPSARGRGCASQLVGALADRITARGERPFLHVASANETAHRIYERLGFTVRRAVRFHGYRVP